MWVTSIFIVLKEFSGLFSTAQTVFQYFFSVYKSKQAIVSLKCSFSIDCESSGYLVVQSDALEVMQVTFGCSEVFKDWKD